MIRDILTMEAYLEKARSLIIYVSKTAIFKTAPQGFQLLSEQGKVNNLKIINVSEKTEMYVYEVQIPFNVPFDFTMNYSIVGDSGIKSPLFIGNFTKTDKFNNIYYYDGDDLGAVIIKEKTYFKLWSPTSTQARLLYRPQNSKTFISIDMKYDKKGIWSVVINKKLTRCQYLFFINMNNRWQKLRDPYAKASTANGVYSVVYDSDAFRDENRALSKKYELKYHTEAIIYRLSLQDFTAHESSGVSKKFRGKYLGLIEHGTVNKYNQATNIDYIKNMGFTHIQLLPVYDFGSLDETGKSNDVYTYGYYPDQLMVPEGSFATDAEDPYIRIKELKQVISYMHRLNIGVIMDISFKRMFNIQLSGFEYSVPGYFFHKSEGQFMFNYDLKMVRKVIVDTFIWWVKAYKIDGFRLSDSKNVPINIINDIRKALLKINKNFIFISDSHRHSQAIELSKRFVNSVFGSSTADGVETHGYLTGDLNKQDSFILGITGLLNKAQPNDNINFLQTLHTRTLHDALSGFKRKFKKEERRQIILLSNCCLTISQGIPLFVQGQEFYRSKQMLYSTEFLDRSFSQLDWNNLETYKNEVKIIKELIWMRKNILPELKLINKNEIRKKNSIWSNA